MRFRGRARRPFRGRRYLATAASSIYLGTDVASTAALIPLIFDAIAQSPPPRTNTPGRSFHILVPLLLLSLSDVNRRLFRKGAIEVSDGVRDIPGPVERLSRVWLCLCMRPRVCV